MVTSLLSPIERAVSLAGNLQADFAYIRQPSVRDTDGVPLVSVPLGRDADRAIVIGADLGANLQPVELAADAAAAVPLGFARIE